MGRISVWICYSCLAVFGAVGKKDFVKLCPHCGGHQYEYLAGLSCTLSEPGIRQIEERLRNRHRFEPDPDP